MNKLQIASV